MTVPDINEERLWDRLIQLAEIDATPGGGVDRQALTDGEAEAWRLVIGWAAEAGLEASADRAANLFLTLPGRDRTLPPLMIGSHLDTQPTGGRFDGAFGVLAALEVATVIAGQGAAPERDLVVVAWMNEEGSRFAPGMMGSNVFAGLRPLEEIRAVVDTKGISAGAEIDRLLSAFPDLPVRDSGFALHAYVEPHIEQHVLLEQAGKAVGIVTAIQGKKTWEIVIAGEKGHAGTLAMNRRRDAVAAFSRISTALYTCVGGYDDVVKFTIGRVGVEPNAPSVVADAVRFRIDLRHPEMTALEACGELVQEICAREAAPCKVKVIPLVSTAPTPFDERLRDMLAAAAAARAIPAMPVLSYAGHDALQMAGVCPSAMIFIPCRDGISHSETEWAEPAHVAAGARVLLDVAAGIESFVR